MSFFNDSNEVAYEAVYGRRYQGNDPCGRPEGITEKDGMLQGTLRIWGAEIDLTGRPVTHKTCADLATEIQAHLVRTS